MLMTACSPLRRIVSSRQRAPRRRREARLERLAQALAQGLDRQRVEDLVGEAAGRVDGYWERGLNPWDVAVGGLIAREAGAIVSGETGWAPGAVLVGAAPGIHEALSALLEATGAGDA